MERTRNNAGANEQRDLEAIVSAIHSHTAAGEKLILAFREKFGLDLLDARTRRGNRGVHYDFQILVGKKDSPLRAWWNVEHKGSQTSSPIPPEQTPWAAGVQFHNGGCDKYSIGRLYAKTWYTQLIGSGVLKQEWSIEAPIPSYEEWFQKDAKAQDNPGTAFGLELKQKVRSAGGSLGDKRAVVQAAFHLTAEDLATFKKEVLDVLNESLSQKHYWLTIHGDVSGEFHCAWYPKFTLSELSSVSMRKEKDIWFDFVCHETKFSCILRSGRACFSNFRVDARDTP